MLAEWERARVNRVTRADVADRWGTERADKITSALVRKGALRRVGKGIFVVVPLRAQARPTMPSAAALVAALLSDEPYYLGGLWALTHHRLTLQQYATRIDAFVTRGHQPRTLANAHVRFHRVPSPRIAHGHEVVSIEGTPARVSTREETLVESTRLPRHGRWHWRRPRTGRAGPRTSGCRQARSACVRGCALLQLPATRGAAGAHGGQAFEARRPSPPRAWPPSP